MLKNKILQKLQINREKIASTFNFAKKSLVDVIELRERKKAGVIDYVNLGLSVKDNYEQSFQNKNNPRSYFIDVNWHPIYTTKCIDIIEVLFKKAAYNMVLMAKNEGDKAYTVKIEGINFGILTYDNYFDAIYVERKHLDSYKEKLSEIFWKFYKSRHITIGCNKNEDIYLKEDEGNYIISDRAVSLSEEINKYIDKGINRSILFYGSPGSGKSTLVRGITSLLNYNSIRINNLNSITPNVLSELLSLFNPDVILLEDIDKITISELSDLLDKLETFNKNLKLVLATANNVEELDDALLRPGRFDKIINIIKLEKDVIRKMVGNDEELYNFAKDFPAAFIVELMKRVKVLGKEEALKSIEDLKDRLKNKER